MPHQENSPLSITSALMSNSEQGMDESMWVEVIQKVDEVYNDLLRYEVALEEKNTQLEESQRFVISVLSSISDILVVCDNDGRISTVNEALVTFSGQTEAQLLGSPLKALFAMDEEWQTFNQLSLTQKQVNDHESSLVSVAGPTSVSLNSTWRINHSGVCSGIVITGRPLGELRLAYQALHDAHENLKRTQQQLLHAEKMASLGRLVAGVAHELNNPISFVLGNTYSLKRYTDRLSKYLSAIHDGVSPETLDEMRDSLHIDRLLDDLPSLIDGTLEGAERTRNIVDSLKRFSAIDRDEMSAFDLIEVIERAVHWVENAASPAFQVESHLPDKLMLKGSASKIQQVVMNLIQNAQDATTEASQPRLTITLTQHEEAVEVHFVDNGPGIPEDNLPQLFEPFFTTKPIGKGTGLGLAISYGIVEHHGGLLTAYNEPEAGAHFVMTLPFNRQENQSNNYGRISNESE